jgi:hypothetical protein
VISGPVAICQCNRACSGRQDLCSFRQVEIEGESHRVVVVRRTTADALARIIKSGIPLHDRVQFTGRPGQLVGMWFGPSAGNRDGEPKGENHRASGSNDLAPPPCHAVI